MTTASKWLVVHPGSSFSTADTFLGLVEALKGSGQAVAEFRLDGRLEFMNKYLHVLWRQMKKQHPEQAWAKPTFLDVVKQSSWGLIERALERNCDTVLIVTAMFMNPAMLVLARRAGLRVLLLCTESPYHMLDEARLVGLSDGAWTNERTVLPRFRQESAKVNYLPHAWRAGLHDSVAMQTQSVAMHDVVFVGTYFPERVALLEAVNWDGIDLGLYGQIEMIPKKSPLQAYIRGAITPNPITASLYRRAKVGLNLFRTTPEGMPPAESLGPRSYELAACGACVLSEYRAEVPEKFGPETPTFQTPEELSTQIRTLLADDTRRAVLASSSRAAVSEDTWTNRVNQMRDDLARWYPPQSFEAWRSQSTGQMPGENSIGQRRTG